METRERNYFRGTLYMESQKITFREQGRLLFWKHGNMVRSWEGLVSKPNANDVKSEHISNVIICK